MYLGKVPRYLVAQLLAFLLVVGSKVGILTAYMSESIGNLSYWDLDSHSNIDDDTMMNYVIRCRVFHIQCLWIDRLRGSIPYLVKILLRT